MSKYYSMIKSLSIRFVFSALAGFLGSHSTSARTNIIKNDSFPFEQVCSLTDFAFTTHDTIHMGSKGVRYIKVTHRHSGEIEKIKASRNVKVYTKEGRKFKGTLWLDNDRFIRVDDQKIAPGEIWGIMVKKGHRSPFFWLGAGIAVSGTALLSDPYSAIAYGILVLPASALIASISLLDNKKYDLIKDWDLELAVE